MKEPPAKISADWDAPRRVLERIVTRRGSIRGLGSGCGRSNMYVWRQLRQNKGFNLVATGKVLSHLGVPASFFYEQVLDLSEPYDAAWALEHFREPSGLPIDPFLAALLERLNPWPPQAIVPGCRRRLAEIEAFEEKGYFDREAAKTDLERLARELLPAAGQGAMEKGRLADAAHLLLVWGAIQQERGRLDDSAEAHALSYRLALLAEDSRALGQFFCSAAGLLARLGQPGTGLRFAEQARRLFQRQRDRGLLAQALVRIGLLLGELRRDEEARAEALTALRLAGRGSWRIGASAWLLLGSLALRCGDGRQALARIRRARKRSRQGDDLEAPIWWREGLVLRRLGRLPAAGDALRRAMAIFGERGFRLEQARVVVDLVEILIEAGRFGEARELAQASTPLFERLRIAEAPASWMDLLALMLQDAWEKSRGRAAHLREILSAAAPLELPPPQAPPQAPPDRRRERRR